MIKSARNSYLLFRPSKGERQRIASRLPAKLRAGMESIKDEEAFRRFAGTVTAREVLSDLVADTAKLLSDLGVDAPKTADECMAEIDQRAGWTSIGEECIKSGVNPVEHFLVGTEEQRALVEDVAIQAVIRLCDAMTEPKFTALSAYEAFKRAEEALADERAADALLCVSLGAVYLARACTGCAALMSSEGGKSRAAGDPKVKAMAKIRDEWEIMRAGGSKHCSDAKFAKDMMMKYPVIENEGSIKNAISRWRKAQSSS